VTVDDAVKPPSSVVAEIIALPMPLEVTLPFASTVAILVLSLVHVIFLFDALEGDIVGVKVVLEFNPLKLSVDSFRERLVTDTAVTVIVAVAVKFPSTVVAVIIADPIPFEVTTPY
jgi:hypothetical protein